MTAPTSRREFLRYLAAGAATAAIAGLPGCAGAPARRRPNLVVILADDHRHDMMGCAGHPWLRTPGLDRLAGEGVRFTDAFVTTSLCSPSRASFLTGCHTHVHGVTANSDRDLTPATPTFPQLLQGAGYETAFVGKWHMGRWASPRPGFDHWVGFNGQGDYGNDTLNGDGDWELSERYVTDELTDRSLAWLDRPRDRPFLLVLSHKAVHEPFTPAPRHRRLYAGTPIPPPDDADDRLDLKPDWGGRRSHAGREAILRAYARTLASVDESVDRLLDRLDERGLRDDTAVVYAGDNGCLFGEHGGLWDKRAAYEESIRVPLLYSAPRRDRRPGTCDAMVLNLDLAPTLLELAGVGVPTVVQGRSWLPGLRGEPGRDAFLYSYEAEKGTVPSTLALRTRAWKYVTYPDDPRYPDELYDLAADPREFLNLAGRADHADRVADLRRRLVREIELIGLERPIPDRGA